MPYFCILANIGVLTIDFVKFCPDSVFCYLAGAMIQKQSKGQGAMNIFDQLSTGTPAAEEAEVKLDLHGMEKDKALAKLDATVKYCKKSSAKSLYVFFDPARPGEGETLFQPVARYFKFEKFNNYIENAVPVMTETSGGFFVRFRI